MQRCLGYLLFMDSVDKSAFYIVCVFSRNKCIDFLCFKKEQKQQKSFVDSRSF